MKISRIPEILNQTGDSRSGLYAKKRDGLMPKFVKIGRAAVGLPSHEVEAIVKARIAGFTDAEIRELVARLESARLGVAA